MVLEEILASFVEATMRKHLPEISIDPELPVVKRFAAWILAQEGKFSDEDIEFSDVEL